VGKDPVDGVPRRKAEEVWKLEEEVRFGGLSFLGSLLHFGHS
jgi:hypothetical protein